MRRLSLLMLAVASSLVVLIFLVSLFAVSPAAAVTLLDERSAVIAKPVAVPEFVAPDVGLESLSAAERPNTRTTQATPDVVAAKATFASAQPIPLQVPAIPWDRPLPTSLPMPRAEETRDALDPHGAGLPTLATLNPAETQATLAPPMPGSAALAVCLDSERVWGLVGTAETATVRVNGQQMGAALSDADGFFWTTLYNGNGDKPGIGGGDTVDVYHNGAQAAGITLRDIDGRIDVLRDIVSGTITGGVFPIDVTVYAPWGEPSTTSYSLTVTTDSSGYFAADLSGIWDFSARHQAVVAYTEGGIEVHRHVFPERSLQVRAFPMNHVMGYAAPTTAITTTLFESDYATVKETALITTDGDGWYFWNPSSVDVLVGDIAKVEIGGGQAMSLAVTTLDFSVDAANDRVTGQTTPGATVRAIVDDLTPHGYRSVQEATTAEASGLFTVEFGLNADIKPGAFANVILPDDEGHVLDAWMSVPYVEVNQTWNDVTGRAPSPPFTLSVGQPVTLTLYSVVSDTTFAYHKGLDSWGWYEFVGDDGLPDIVPGDVVTVETAGYAWQGVVSVMSMSAAHDVVADVINGSIVSPTDEVELHGYQLRNQPYPLAGSFDTLATTDGSGAFAAAAPGFDIRNLVDYLVSHRTPGDHLETISQYADGVVVYPIYNAAWAYIGPPGTLYTMTLRDGGGAVKAQFSDNSYYPGGDTGWRGFWWSGENMYPGDKLQVESAAGFSQTVDIPSMNMVPNAVQDVIRGTGPADSLLYVNVTDQGEGYVPTDNFGNFALKVDQLQNFYGSGDITWGDEFEVCYENTDRNFVCWHDPWPQIGARSFEDQWNDVIGWNDITGKTMHITVTHPVSGVRATGTTAAGTCQGCRFDEFYLDLPNGVIVPGNTVHVGWGVDLVESVDIVLITAAPDVNSDIITGTAPAGGLLSSFISDYWDNRADLDNIQVDASGIYTLDFGSVGWDVQFGQTFHIYYHAAHDHQIERIFELPAPEVWLQKETTPGHAEPGSNYLYRFRYGNNGNGVAESAIITDSVPAGLTYVANTLGLPTVQVGDILTITLGDLSPGYEGDFFAAFAVGPGIPLQSNLPDNCARINTTSPGDFDPGNDGVCSGEIWVDQGDAGLWVDKWPEPADPSPGQEFVYVLDYGSEGGVATGPAWLTDTLPVSTTVIGWYDEWDWGALWTEVVTSSGTFALYAPAGIPGDMGGRIRLRLLLDPNAPIGLRLENTALLTTAVDIDPSNNWELDTEALVSGPRYDMRLEKSIHEYVPTPGGWVNYFLDYRNEGNTAAHIVITDTVPPGLTYAYAHWGGGQPQENDPFPAPTIIGDELIWDLGAVPVAQNAWFHVQMDIGSGVDVGSNITNCAAAGTAYADDTPADNTSCYPIHINPVGPNLAVDKWLESDNGNGFEYNVHFANIGNQTEHGVWITDTLPLSTTWDGWWNLDGFDWGRIVAETQTGDSLGWQLSEIHPGETGWLQFNVSLDDPGDRPHWYTNTVNIDEPTGDTNPADNFDQEVTVKGEVDRVEIQLPHDGSSGMWGQAQEGAAVTVTTPYTEVTAWADPSCGGCWDIGNTGELYPGDKITVTAGRGLLPVHIEVPSPFTVEVDSTADVVYGQIGGWYDQEVEVNGYWSNGFRAVTSDGSGNFFASYPDVPRGGDGQVAIYTAADYAQVSFYKPFRTRDLILNVNYEHDWVNGNYEVGHTLWITVTESDGVTVKATAEIQTWNIPWWGGTPGFETQWEDWQPGPGADLLPGDWVFASLDNGYTSTVQIGEITGHVDVSADTITGTFTIDWYQQLLNANCGVWEEGGPGQDFLIDPQGDTYSCDFGSMGWDLLPGHDVGVQYQEPDGDWVINIFEEPIPNLHISKWGNGEPGEGGNYAFTVQYWNDGNADAHNVVITDTMFGGLTYIGDTLGIPYSGSGSGPIVWDLGHVPSGTDVQFEVFAQVTAAAGSPISNVVDIASGIPFDDGDPSELHAEWQGNVLPNETQLNVGKWNWTGDPAAGENVVWTVNVCNNGGTGSTQVTVTDTLPISTTLQNWWGDRAGWIEAAPSGSELVLTYPSIPGWDCRSVNLRFTVDPAAWSGLLITNTAQISAANDLDPNDNYTENTVWVNDPHTNLDVDKWWNWGQLVPGGRLSYGIGFGNNGNVPAGTFRITDTLPVSTSFHSAWTHDQFGQQHPLVPVYTGTHEVAFEFPGIENGFGENFEVQVVVDSHAVPGTVLTNMVEVTPLPGEDSYDDNFASWVETVFDHGPNLRVTKNGSWDDWGPDTRRASYQLGVENVGDVGAYHVSMTDTYPAGMYLDGGVGADHWGWWTWQDDPNNGYFTATFDYIGPASTAWVNFGAMTDTNPLPFGLVFTNTAEVMLAPGDTNPADNLDSVVLTTGPDLYLEKRLVAGDVKPGSLITFSLTYGENHQGHEWWWNPDGGIWITETLPAGLEFVSARERTCGWCVWPPDGQDGNSYGWNVGGIGTGHWGELYVTARIADSARAGDIFSNQAVIVSTEPINDVEPFYANNSSQVDLLVAMPELSVGKESVGNGVAGTEVLYILTLTNTGNVTATNAVLSDVVPSGVTYGGSDGTYDGVDTVTWILDVPADTDYLDDLFTFFTGTLTCSAGETIVNDNYRIVSSNQGVDSPVGPPVAFSTVAPALQATFNVNPTSAVVGTQFSFTDQSSTDGRPIVDWEWDFGDGSPHATTQDVNHTYITYGVMDVTLTVTDSCGFSDQHTVQVTVNQPNLVPSFIQSSAVVILNHGVYFTDTSTTDGPAITAWQWDFGDGGSPDFGQQVNHFYEAVGTYTVTLTITDTLGYSASLAVQDAVAVKKDEYFIYLPVINKP